MSIFFFFSSRRRHTRSTRDWSSDVCSSDLGSETTSALVPPRLRPYCPANSKAPKPKMISGAKNFRKFREYIMALRPSTIRLQVLRLTDGHAKYVELLSKADVFVFLVARFHLNPPICCSLSCWWRKAAVVAASAVILVVVAYTSAVRRDLQIETA